MLEIFSWTSSLLIQLLFRYFLQGFYLDSKLLLLLHFRFPRACIFQNTSFSHPFMVAGLGITWQLTRWETVMRDFLGYLRLPESSIKIWGMMLMVKIKSLIQHFVVGLFQAWSLKFKSILVFYETFK